MGRWATAAEVRQLLKRPGVHRVGPGLYLRVRETGSAWWMYRYMHAGRAHELSLGPYYSKTLAEARAEAESLRLARRKGEDPLAARRAKAVSQDTFRECAERYIELHKSGWSNEKHAQQWANTLAQYAYSTIGDLPVSSIETRHVLQVLEPIWSVKTETASRVRQRVEAVLDWAAVAGLRSGDNPARWRGHLDKLLPKPSKVARVEHHSALPWRDLPVFMRDLCTREGIGARALEFAILTAARSGEVRGAAWSEIDLDAALWVIPAERMKARREHRVPLSDAALALLRSLPRMGDLVFPGTRPGRPLSDMSLTAVLRRMGRGDLTVHGFRSTFRDWVSEATSYSAELAEAALAHVVADKTQAAYQRGDMLEKRRDLMQAWGDYATAS